jgi:hypothetical protein
MQEFGNIVGEWGLLIIFLAVYARMRYGKQNIQKYERWDKIRKGKKRGRKK